MTFYCTIITAEDMEWTGKNNNCLTGEKTEFADLKRVVRPHNNGTGRCREKVVLHHTDGTVESVDGHFIGSGKE